MELLERFTRGDLDAFEMLFRQFQGEVYRWIARILRDPRTAEDVTLETFWRIYRARSRFDPKRSFGAWARRIATNAALDHLKTARREVPLPQQLPERPTPDGIARQDVCDAVHRAFFRLPAKLRAVATLALVEELPLSEIGGALGISVAAVKSRQFRAVRLLRKELLRLGVEP
ncbi:MAG: RNA polymerase sigma factor [Acidobacteriia bacterium]|nr:RNA polymerase sigma factor [Terriglobia bacterium]